MIILSKLYVIEYKPSKGLKKGLILLMDIQLDIQLDIQKEKKNY